MEFCGLKAGLRRAVIAPISWINDVKAITYYLGIRPAPLFFYLNPFNENIESAFYSLDYGLVGELLSRLFQDEDVGGDELLGGVCGFPSCCIQAYENRYAGKAFMEYKEACKRLGRDPFHLERYKDDQGWFWFFGKPFVSHIPCSPECERSMDLAGTYEKLCANCQRKACGRTDD